MRICPSCRTRFPPGSNFCPYDGQSLEDLQEDAPQHDEFLNTVLDTRYRVESRLGKGGMGVVYAARHIVIDKPVAIKILRQEYSSDPHQVERFMREARAASRIGHPNIVDVTDFGTLPNGQIYFVMEYLLGVTLSRELRLQGALPPRRALDLSTQICHALGAAHAKGIVHRDLKPENIFIVNPITASSPSGVAGRRPDWIKLLDFGIAKITWDQEGRRLTRVGSIFGTPQYMSPEQASGKDADHRGDLYALGCIIYEMLTGEVPFLADTFMGTLTKHMFERPVPPRQLRPDLRIAPPVEAIILKAMEKNPDERFQSMAEMTAALAACAGVCEPTGVATPVVVHLPAGATPTLVEDDKLETVHLLVQPRTETPGALAPTEPQAGRGPQARPQPQAPEATPPPGGEDVALPKTSAPLSITRPPTGRWLPVVVIGATLVVAGGGVAVYVASSSQKNGSARTDARASQPLVMPSGTRDARAARSAAAGDLVVAAADLGGRAVTLSIRTTPPGAQVWINGQRLALTPLVHRVRAAEKYAILIRKKGYQEVSRTISPSADQELTVGLVSKRQQTKVETGRHRDARVPTLRTKELRIPCEINPAACKKQQ